MLQFGDGVIVANFVFAGIIGAIVGSVELVSRYKDNPAAALRERPSWLYIAVNATASLLAYEFVTAFDLTFGIDGRAHADRLALTQVFVAGISAMAVFRTSLFSARIGGDDYPVGPGLILQVLLNATDRAVDRNRAIPRAKDVPELMADVDFDLAKEALPSFCFGIMQNIGSDEQAAARNQVAIVENSKVPPPIKSMLLGLLLVNLVGIDVLEAAVTALKEQIAAPPPPLP